MQLFDTHCHIDVEDFAPDRNTVLRNAKDAGVAELLVPGVESRTWPELTALCAGDPALHLALGLHPVYLARHREQDIDALADAVDQFHPLAIGEIGLDWYVRTLDRDAQQRLFERQLDIAKQFDLPVVLHTRKAHDAILTSLRRVKLRGGFSHAFNGSIQQAQQYADLGFCLGFGGMLTFQRSSRLRKLASLLPLESIVLETDAPDMTVASHQYQRNSPEFLPEILDTLVELRDESAHSIATQTTRNAHRVLGLPLE